MFSRSLTVFSVIAVVSIASVTNLSSTPGRPLTQVEMDDIYASAGYATYCKTTGTAPCTAAAAVAGCGVPTNGQCMAGALGSVDGQTCAGCTGPMNKTCAFDWVFGGCTQLPNPSCCSATTCQYKTLGAGPNGPIPPSCTCSGPGAAVGSVLSCK